MKRTSKTAPATQTWFIENHSQGYDSLQDAPTKAEAVAAHKAKHPETINDNVKAYKLK